MAEFAARHIVAIMTFLVISVQFMIKLNLSVTIETMIKMETTRRTPMATNMCPSNHTSSMKILISRDEPNNDGDLDWDESDKPKILSSYFYGFVPTQLIGGWASERWGSRYVCGLAVLATGLIVLIAPTAALTGLSFFIVQRVCVGAASGVVMPSINCLISKWFPPKERTRLSGVIFSSPSFGSLVAMGVSGLLIERAHWSATFYLFGALSITLFIPWYFLIYDCPSKHPRISEKEVLYISQRLGEKPHAIQVALPVPWGSLLTCIPMWAAILFNTGNAWITCTLASELPTYLMLMVHTGKEKSGVLSAVPYFFSWITGTVFGFISQFLRDKGLLSHLGAYRVFNGIAAFGSAAALLGVTLVGCNTVAVVVLMVVATVACSALFGGSCLNHMDLARNYAGTISGLLFTAISMPGILAPFIAGILTERRHTFEQWNKVFYIAAAISVSTYLVYLVFGSVDEQPWNVPKQRATIEMTETQYTEEQDNTDTSTEHESNLLREEQVNNVTSTEQKSNRVA